jgi:hypothetical protein
MRFSLPRAWGFCRGPGDLAKHIPLSESGAAFFLRHLSLIFSIDDFLTGEYAIFKQFKSFSLNETGHCFCANQYLEDHLPLPVKKNGLSVTADENRPPSDKAAVLPPAHMVIQTTRQVARFFAIATNL